MLVYGYDNQKGYTIIISIVIEFCYIIAFDYDSSFSGMSCSEVAYTCAML